ARVVEADVGAAGGGGAVRGDEDGGGGQDGEDRDCQGAALDGPDEWSHGRFLPWVCCLGVALAADGASVMPPRRRVVGPPCPRPASPILGGRRSRGVRAASALCPPAAFV